jgi:DNA-directed RNA polymerase subunit RPC12/RpoP
MVITCPKCKKVFGRPLNMLDFSKGTAKLVNVCPYCNYILGSAAEEDSESTRVILPDKTEIEQK